MFDVSLVEQHRVVGDGVGAHRIPLAGGRGNSYIVGVVVLWGSVGHDA